VFNCILTPAAFCVGSSYSVDAASGGNHYADRTTLSPLKRVPLPTPPSTVLDWLRVVAAGPTLRGPTEPLITPRETFLRNSRDGRNCTSALLSLEHHGNTCCSTLRLSEQYCSRGMSAFVSVRYFVSFFRDGHSRGAVVTDGRIARTAKRVGCPSYGLRRRRE
jgi:hypothetical protein